MSDELQRLRKAYRDVRAPADVARRVRVRVGEPRGRRGLWMPVSAVATAVVIAGWLLPLLMQETDMNSAQPLRPSLTTLASLKPKKPAKGTPSLTQLRSVSVPTPPRKPKPGATEPQSNYQPHSDFLKGKHYAHS